MNYDSPTFPSFPTSPTLPLFLLHFLCTSHPYVSYFYASSKCLFFLSHFHPPYNSLSTTSFHPPLKTSQLFPDSISLRLADLQLFPIVYENESEIDFYRQRFSDCLYKISDNLSLDTDKDKTNALQAISLNTNFYLQYQGKVF